MKLNKISEEACDKLSFDPLAAMNMKGEKDLVSFSPLSNHDKLNTPNLKPGPQMLVRNDGRLAFRAVFKKDEINQMIRK